MTFGFFQKIVLSTAKKPIATSFTPNTETKTPLRASTSKKTPRSDKRASVKRKIQENGQGKESKRGALSLS